MFGTFWPLVLHKQRTQNRQHPVALTDSTDKVAARCSCSAQSASHQSCGTRGVNTAIDTKKLASTWSLGNMYHNNSTRSSRRSIKQGVCRKQDHHTACK
jgi:hypothetical protein